MGERKRKALACQRDVLALDTFGGRIHVEWDPNAAATPLGQLPFFIEFLKVTELLLFYGFLTLAVGLGVGYSLHLYRRHERQRESSPGRVLPPE